MEKKMGTIKPVKHFQKYYEVQPTRPLTQKVG